VRGLHLAWFFHCMFCVLTLSAVRIMLGDKWRKIDIKFIVPETRKWDMSGYTGRISMGGVAWDMGFLSTVMLYDVMISF